MRDAPHIMLPFGRGGKVTSRINSRGSCLMVLAGGKLLVPDDPGGIRINDPKTYHNKLLNNMRTRVLADISGMNTAFMLDHLGFVSELNDANLFMIKEGMVYPPLPGSCLQGIAWSCIFRISRDFSVPLEKRNLSLTEIHPAAVAVATGALGEIPTVKEINSNQFVNHLPITRPKKSSRLFQSFIPQYLKKLN